MGTDKMSTTARGNRKTSKPIMEKRRRARINASLSELKSLLLKDIKKENAHNSKMEKADILEMTVKHLRAIQRQEFAVVAESDDKEGLTRYRLGFHKCAQEVDQYLQSSENLSAELRTKLIDHLGDYIYGIPANEKTPARLKYCEKLLSDYNKVTPVASSGGPVSFSTLNPLETEYPCPLESKDNNFNISTQYPCPLESKDINFNISTETTVKDVSVSRTVSVRPHTVNHPKQGLTHFQETNADRKSSSSFQVPVTTTSSIYPGVALTGLQVYSARFAAGEWAVVIPASLVSSGYHQSPSLILVPPSWTTSASAASTVSSTSFAEVTPTSVEESRLIHRDMLVSFPLNQHEQTAVSVAPRTESNVQGHWRALSTLASQDVTGSTPVLVMSNKNEVTQCYISSVIPSYVFSGQDCIKTNVNNNYLWRPW